MDLRSLSRRHPPFISPHRVMRGRREAPATTTMNEKVPSLTQGEFTVAPPRATVKHRGERQSSPPPWGGAGEGPFRLREEVQIPVELPVGDVRQVALPLICLVMHEDVVE